MYKQLVECYKKELIVNKKSSQILHISKIPLDSFATSLRLGGPFFNGRQTGQSVRLQNFQ